MLYKIEENSDGTVILEKMNFQNFHLEKILENILADNMNLLFDNEHGLLTICQEKPFQEEQDITALDSEGSLYIFELKKESIFQKDIAQILRYANKYIGVNYEYLNNKAFVYRENATELKYSNDYLKKEFCRYFQKDFPLEHHNFSIKLILIGLDAHPDAVSKIEYWKNKGIDICFIPYRVFKINNENYFEISSYPFDNQYEVSSLHKGILFDTNSSYTDYVDLHGFKNSTEYMINSKIVSAWGDASRFVDSFKKDDYAFLYQSGVGIMGLRKKVWDQNI